MIDNLLENYFESDKLPWHIPLDIDVLTAGDYHLYLYDFGASWHVVVEADYFIMKATIRDIEHSFPVHVNGWCVLNKYKKDAGTELPPDSDDYDPEGVNDMNYHNRLYTVHQERGMKYALLRVTPNAGVTANDFGLTYFAQ